MKADDPRHGEYRGAIAHERSGVPLCDPCREAKRAYTRLRDKERTLGRGGLVDTTLVRRHIAHLVDSGMSLADIARAAKVARDTVRRIHNGSVAVVLERTLRRLAAVQPQAPDHFRPALGYRRRLQALVALGHPAKQLADRTGMSESRFSMFLDGTLARDTVRVATADAIDALWAELSMTPGKSVRSVNRARRKGWLPPLAWDDIDTDQAPHAGQKITPSRDEIDEVVVIRILGGEKLDATKAEREEVVRRWIAMRQPTAELERRLGWKPERYAKRSDAA